MLTAELKVNGVLIGVLYIHNFGPANITPSDLYDYEAVYHRIGVETAPQTGQFEHNRSAGAEVCVEKALKSLR